MCVYTLQSAVVVYETVSTLARNARNMDYQLEVTKSPFPNIEINLACIEDCSN